MACFVLVARISAAPCSQIKAHPDAWVNAKINALVATARAAYEAEAAQPAYERTRDGIAAVIKGCGLAGDPDFSGRYHRFVEYVSTLTLEREPDYELGFAVPDRVYFEETHRLVSIPEFLLTPQFLNVVTRAETLPQAKAMLGRLNTDRSPEAQLLFFSYRSRHLGTPDNPNSYLRLLVVVPGIPAEGVPEKWVQFGVRDPGSRAVVRNVSVVAAVADGEGSTNFYFKDYFRTFKGNGSITIKGRWELGEGDDNCTVCHKSGVLPIFPVAGSVSRDERDIVEAVNARFLSYSRPRFGKYLDPSKLGPGLGSKTLRLSSGAAVTCAECHQPNQLGALNWPMDRTLISSFVKGGQMPYGFRLTAIERRRLYLRLIADYFSIDEAKPGILKAWLMGEPGQTIK